MSTTDSESPFDWGELGEAWWLDAAKTAGASPRQAMFACAKHRGASNTGAAREAGYQDSESDGIRQQGYRTFRTTKVQNLLALAAAEAKGGVDGTVDGHEAKRILSKLARGSDPAIKIRAVEALEKIATRETELEKQLGNFDVLKGLTQFAQRSVLCALLADEMAQVHDFEFDASDALRGAKREEFLTKKAAIKAVLEGCSQSA